ncbi:MAG TPA: pilus assembly protein FlpE [Cellulomonas sp.]
MTQRITRRAAGAGVVGVVGARGGAGSTVTAAVLAAALARHGPTALVDLGPGPPLEVVLGTEAKPGARWPDLVGARGQVDADDLVRSLPRWSGCTLLSGDPTRPGPAPAAVLPDVLAALAAGHVSVVLDLGRDAVRDGAQSERHGAEAVPVVDRCAVLLLVVPRDVPAVVGAQGLRAALLGGRGPVGLVVRGPAPGGLGVAEVARAVDLPLLGSLPGSRSVAARVDRGLGPALGRRGARRVESLADRLLRRRG